MDHVRDHFLADAALAGDEDVRLGGRHRRDQLVDLLHHLAFENRREPRLGLGEALLQVLGRLAQLERFPEERLFFERFLDQAEQLFRRVGFTDEMIGAALDRLDRVVQGIVRGQNDDLGVGMLGLDLLEHVEAVRIGQLQVEQDKSGRFALEQAHPGGGIGRHVGLITVPA